MVISLSHDVILIVIIRIVNLVECPLYLFYVLDMMCSFDDISGVHGDAGTA